MTSNANIEKISDRSGSVDLKTGIELLNKQIEAAERMLNNKPIRWKDRAAWNNKTRDYLIKIYGAGSPNIDTIIKASGSTPVWLGMPQEVRDRFEASSMENKLQRLAACIVSLQAKGKLIQSQKIDPRESSHK